MPAIYLLQLCCEDRKAPLETGKETSADPRWRSRSCSADEASVISVRFGLNKCVDTVARPKVAITA